MRLIFLVIISATLTTQCSVNPSNQELTKYSAKKIGELPAKCINEKNPGVAGAFSGIINDKLIIAGGANFMDKKPWEGGTKTYHDKIYAFELKNDSLKTIDLTVTLPEPLAYGASISMKEGILCIGGNGPVECSSKVYLIKWDEAANDIIINYFPELPAPLSFSTAVMIDEVVYVTGGSSSPGGVETQNYFFMLDLSKRNTPEFEWEKLPPYPGISRILSVSVAQSNETRKCIYLFSGRNISNTDKPVVLNDGLIYDPVSKKWDTIPMPYSLNFPVMAGSAFPSGKNNIVFIGGVADTIFLKELHLKIDIADAIQRENELKSDSLKVELNRFYNEHQGFSSKILIYNTRSNTISTAGNFNTFCPVTTSAIPYMDGAIVASGEIKPGIRTPDIFIIKQYN